MTIPDSITSMHISKRCSRWAVVLGLVAGVTVTVPAVSAATTDNNVPQQLTPGQMAFNGYWSYAPGVPPAAAIAAMKRLGGGAAPGASPMVAMVDKMQPWAAAEFAKKVALAAAGKYFSSPTSRCMPFAIPGVGGPGGNTYGIHIMVEPHQVTFFHEVDRIMRIVRIGKQHPVNLAPSWLGHSVGHWEGDTLVIDTIGFNDQNVLANAIPVTNKMHIVQRLDAADGKMVEHVSFDDPGALTSTLDRTIHYLPAQPFQEYVCAENNGQGGVPTSTGQPTPFVLATTPAKPPGAQEKSPADSQ